jgi:aspartyl-tRNA(Asn)/glutamyl-tRNA(Gln) amidotransferase subunit A
VPLALKDVFTAAGMPTTCGSKILDGWYPPYDATVTRRLREAGIVILGKTNMDEFAMGSSTENSAFGPTHNPWDLSRIPGGSGGGSSASLAAFEAAVEQLRALGATVVEVSCPHFVYALPAYYLIAPSECSSNLARFDAMRYGLRVGDDRANSAEEVMSLTREAGFGAEVKRRIMLGTYALSAGYYDAFYGQAQKVRTLITRDFAAAFEQVDVLISPTTPTTAFPIGERADDPMAMYLADLCTIPTNLAGNCAISIPIGMAPEDGLPVGLQIMAPSMADDRLYRVGAALESALTAQWGHPLHDEMPPL